MNSKRPKILTIILVALFAAMFAASLYYLAIYPIVKDSAVQKQHKEKYESAYKTVTSAFGPYGINVYSYDDYENMQKIGRLASDEYYLSQVQPVVQPDINYYMLMQEKDLGPLSDQTQAMESIVPEEGQVAYAYFAPEDFVGKQVQYYDFILKDDRLTPYYQRLADARLATNADRPTENQRNNMPFVRLIVDNQGNVMRSLVILQLQPQGEGGEAPEGSEAPDGCSYWGVGTPGEDIINSIIAIYESRPEIFASEE